MLVSVNIHHNILITSTLNKNISILKQAFHVTPYPTLKLYFNP